MSNRKDILVQSLVNPNDQIRRAAAEALEGLDIRSRILTLRKLIKEGSKVEKLRAIYAVGSLRGSQVEKVLLEATGDEVEDIRAAAIRSLGEFADTRILPELLGKLQDPSPVVERVVIDALYHFREPQIVGPLMNKLKSKDAGVVERAIHAIGRTGDKRAEEAMLFYAAKGTTAIKVAAMKALGMMET